MSTGDMKTTAYNVLWLTMMMIVSRVICQKSKGSIFDSKPIRVQDYGVPPATSTIPLYECTGSHRPKKDIPNAYEVYHDKQWYLQTCQEGLTWNQTLCRCEFPNGRPLVVQCRDYRATSMDPTGKYEQLVNGQWIVRDCSLAVAGLVWDQEACQCVWGPDSKEMVTGQGIAPCEIMLNMTFENGVKDEGKGSYVEVGRGNPVPIFAVNKRDSPDGYKAAYFSDTALNIWYFAGNEMGSSLRVEFRFKMTNDPIQREKYQIFISNGCNISSPGYTTPSLAIGYRAADQSYLLAFETTTARKAIVCTRKLGAYDWHTISLIYEDGTLLFRVDEQPCIISQDFSGPVQKTPCPLTIGADPLERESMYKGYLDNLLIARYCRRFMDTDPNESTDKTKGPMPVETAPTVSEFSFQQVRPKSDKQSSHSVPGRKQRAVTSTKYLPELPGILKSAVENVEEGVARGQFLEKLMGAREYTQSFLRFPRSGDDSHGSFQGETSRREHGKEFTRHDTVNEQENDYDNAEKPDGEFDDSDKSDVSGKQANDYDTHVKASEQENRRSKFKNDADSRRGYNNPGKSKGKLREKSPDGDEAGTQSSGTRQLSRQDNNNQKFRKVEEFNDHIQHSEQTRKNDKKNVHSYSDDASTSSNENNEEEKRHVNTQVDNESEDHHEHGNSRDGGRQRNDEEQRNDWIPLEKRRGSKYESTNTEKRRKTATSRENRNGEDVNTSRDYRKTRGKSQSVERFTKTDESEGDHRNSGRTSGSYEGNSPREVQKSDENDSNNRKLVNRNEDDDELSYGNGKIKRNKSGNNAGYRKKGVSEKSNGFDDYNNEREFINGRNSGFKGNSDNLGKDDDNVENYSKERAKEEREVTDSHEDFDYAQQTKVQDHDGEQRKSDRTNTDKTRDSGQGKKSGGRGHVRGKTEQWQVYKGKVHDTVNSNFGIQEKGPRESDGYSDNFEGNKKEGFDSESRSNTEPKLTRKIATRNEDKHMTLGVSKHQDVTEDRIWNDDKKFDDSEDEDINWGPKLAKSRPVRHDRGDISRLAKQQNAVETGSEKDTGFDISSMESASNLVKGRRKSGSKKKNWYDKADATGNKQQESSNSDEKKTQGEQNPKPLSSQKSIGKENKRSGKVEIVYSDIHNLQYDQPLTSDKSSDSLKSKNGKDDDRNTHSFDVPGNINFGKTFRKPEAHGFIVKDYNENYEEDDQSDQSPRADNTARVSRDATDKKEQYTKDHTHLDSTNDQNLSITTQTLKTSEQKHKNLEGSEQAKDKGESHDQEKNTSLTPQKEEREPEDVSSSHFNMPVDVTKITSSRSSTHVTSNIPQDKTPDMSDLIKQSPAASETGKSLGH